MNTTVQFMIKIRMKSIEQVSDCERKVDMSMQQQQQLPIRARTNSRTPSTIGAAPMQSTQPHQ